MLTFRTMLLFTVLLLVPVIISFRNMLRQRDSMFLQMLLGYTGCYFMKNVYALLNRVVNGIENDGLEMDWVAMLGIISFLAAAWFCLGYLSQEGKNNMDIFKRKLRVFMLVGIMAVLVESFAGAAGNRILFIICYLISVICIYATAIMVAAKVKDAGDVQENIKKR